MAPSWLYHLMDKVLKNVAQCCMVSLGAVHLRDTNLPFTARPLICQNCFFLPGPHMTPHCQAKSCTLTFTKCKWECTVRAQGSTALLPRKLKLKVCFQLSTGTQSFTSQSHHWQRYSEIAGDYQRSPFNACVQQWSKGNKRFSSLIPSISPFCNLPVCH